MISKCSGSEIPRSIHTFGVPGPHCPCMQGLLATDSPTSPELKESLGVEKELVSTAADEAGLHTCSNITVDEEATGQVKLKQLHIAEQVLQKKARVAMLKKPSKKLNSALLLLLRACNRAPPQPLIGVRRLCNQPVWDLLTQANKGPHSCHWMHSSLVPKQA